MFAAGLVALAAATWAMAEWLVAREWSSGPEERTFLVAWAPVLGAALVSTGLAGADEELERSTAAPWRRIRLLHVVVATVTTGAALGLTGLWEPQTYGAFELARNALASVGLVTITAVVLGARLAWGPLFAYIGVVYFAAPRSMPETGWWSWPVQPWSAELAAWTALGLFAAGLAVYGWFGARPSREAERG